MQNWTSEVFSINQIISSKCIYVEYIYMIRSCKKMYCHKHYGITSLVYID